MGTELRREIMQHMCIVVLNHKGELERVTAVVALKIQRGHDELLVQLGKFNRKQNALERCCLLPGAIRMLGESVGDAVQRILATALFHLEGIVEQIHCTAEPETRMSERF